MAGEISATILVPTTGDRGPLLRYSVGSILRQTVSDIEVFVIGDGVDEATRRAARALAKADGRVRFFDHPKHERRGETYRHVALGTARGRIVCYLCDRDLMLADHVERMGKALRGADLAFSHRIRLKADGSLFADPVAGGPRPGPLSMVAHTLDAYRRLPHGWRTTPPGHGTDSFMWQQFEDQAGCRIAPQYFCSIIYLQRGEHPGWSTEKRLAEIRPLFERYIDPGPDDYEQAVWRDLIVKEHVLRKLKDRMAWLALGAPIGDLMERSIRRRMSRLKR